jgi:hypothetical protein
MVRDQLAAVLAGVEDVTLVALVGVEYRTAPQESPWPNDVPMQGLGIGHQLRWLTAQLSGTVVNM